MDLGAFSMSLAGKDLEASRQFYTELGFTEMGGAADQGWLILRSGACTLGLFQGHIAQNMLTFNPGWSAEAEPIGEFEDVRSLQARLKAVGATYVNEAAPDGTGRLVRLGPRAPR